MGLRTGGAGRFGAGSVLAWAVGMGLLSGSMELAAFLLKCRWLDPRNLNVGRHYPWMFPVAGAAVLFGPGLVLAVAVRARPGRATPEVVLCVLSFLAAAGVLFRAPIYTSLALILAAGLAYRSARFLGPRAGRLDRSAKVGAVAMLGLVAATAGWALGREAWLEGRTGAGTPGGRSKNVILIVLDTVRADSLGLYGYSRDTSPNLARLATRGVRFDRAYSTAPWTAPSHASMFTGRSPHELSIGWDRPLDNSAPTLAEALAARGYATAGFVANTTYCSAETGLARGFDHYEDYDVTPRAVLLCSALVQRTLNFAHKYPGLARLIGEGGNSAGGRKDAARINRDFLGWLGDHRDRPFFAFLNYYDAHHPYLAPEGPGAGPSFGRGPGSPEEFRLLRTWWEMDKRKLGPGPVALARDSYDRCIAYLDGQVGRLFDDLERLGVLRDSLVIVTADHGEHLGERQLFGHGCSVYRPELHVPLLVIDPGAAPAGLVIDEPVSLRDIPATVLGQLGRGGPGPFPGRSLARTWSGGIDEAPEPVLSEVVAPPEDDPNKGGSPARFGPLRSLVDRDYHYIRDGGGREELYDLRVDPAEGNDLAGSPGVAAALRRYRDRLPQ